MTKSNVSKYSSDVVITKALEEVMHDSMLPYSEFVIMDRALPRVEDGLKPVQRRVLYSMLEVGVLPDRPFRKSARIVGDCMGKYHPHGDRSIYDTMVRMAQDFNMGEVLVSGHGNFGSVDGDGAAAMRYTEARLAPIALELLRDIEKNTVSWSFNFDDSCKEPDMLPGRFPNLLVNGAYGIAVGLATNIPTHNLNEVCNLVGAYIDNKNITVDEMLTIMPGPDFPTGGYIMEGSEIKKAYETGKGKLILRAKLHIENGENDKKSIVITEIPYQVNKAQLLQRIVKLKEADQTDTLTYISEIVDESDRTGMRAVIKLKKNARVNAILNMLYKYSDLETSFNVNMVAIADGKPKLMSLREILDYYVNYQQKVIYNRTKYDLEVALKKEHILEGLLIAINNIDEVVRIIKTSKNVTDAKITLMNTFTLSDVQAQAILDMRLARLTSLEVTKLVTELNRLKDLIKRYTEILKSPRMQMKIVKKEILEIAGKYKTGRKSLFAEPNDEIEETEVKDSASEEVHVIYSPSNTIKTVSTKSYNLATKELSVANATINEIPEISFVSNSNKTVYGFTNKGVCIKLDVAKINQTKFKDKGTYIHSLCSAVDVNDKFVSIIELSEQNKDEVLLFVTKKGMVKLTKVGEYFASKQAIASIKLKDDDEVVYVGLNSENLKLAVFTKDGYAMVCDKADIAVSGRVSVGVKSIALQETDNVVSAMQVGKSDIFVVVTNDAGATLMKYTDIPESARNRKGTKIIKSGNILLADLFNTNTNYVFEDVDKSLKFVANKNIQLPAKETKTKKTTKMLSIVNAYKYVVDPVTEK